MSGSEIGQGFRLCFPKQMGGLPYMPEELGIGVIENGQLSEERPAKAAAPAKITEKQIKFIHTLLDLKGKEKKAIHQYYMVASIADLTMEQASRAIAKLQTYPDLQPDTFEPTAKEIDNDEIEAGIQKQQLEEEGHE